MSRNIVESYDENEFNESGLGQVLSGKNRKNVLFLLILSVVVAIAFWLFVTANNNTCTGVHVEVIGNEQLMSYNYSVSSIEPSSIDIVLKGKDSVIDQIIDDKSLISARVNVFGKEDGSVASIFKSPEDVRDGEFEVQVEVIAPSGVVFDTKTVKVTVSLTKSLEKQGDEITFEELNYSISKGYSISSKVVTTEKVVVSGDEDTISKIDHIGLSVNWLKDIRSDVELFLTPVAYDRFGGIVDSRFLRFEPAQIGVYVTVNRTKKITLDVIRPEGDIGSYTLSPSYIILDGPVSLIDEIGETIYVNKDAENETVAGNYTVDVKKLVKGGENLTVIDENTENPKGNDAFTVKVEPNEGKKETTLFLNGSEIRLILPEGYKCENISETLTVKISYFADKNTEIRKQNVVVFADFSSGALRDGKPEIYFKDVKGMRDIVIEDVSELQYELVKAE